MPQTHLPVPSTAASGDEQRKAAADVETLEDRRRQLTNLVGRLLATQWSKRVLCPHSPPTEDATLG